MNNDIFPCLLYKGDAKDSAEFYSEVFNGKITTETPFVYQIELFGQKMMLLNGPDVEKNASISFTILCETEEEVDQYWKPLSDGGMILMELGEYPWSKKYGWVRDKFGVTWQVYLGKMQGDQKIIPTLMFLHHNNGKAMNAMEFYTQIFANSKIGGVLNYGVGIGDENHEIPENVQHADFEINGFTMFCMDNSYDHKFDFNDGISIVVMTENQDQTDYYWSALTADGGEENVCGWLRDKYGISWQIVPKIMSTLMSGSDPEKAQKGMEAMMKMKKMIIADIENAYNS